MTSREVVVEDVRGNRIRWAVAVIAVLASMAALAAPAGAWIRSRSNISADAEAVSVCSSQITLSATLAHSTSSFEADYPTFVGVPDVTPYPGLPTEAIDLYGSTTDALAGTNEVATVVVPRTYRSNDALAYRFSGEATISTPAGFENGDNLYVWAYDSTLSRIAVPLTVGDPIYDCPAENLNWAVLSRGNAVQVNAFLPHTIIFETSSVDPKSLTVSAGGAAIPVAYIGGNGTLGIGYINLNTVGLTCDTTTLVLEGVDAGGYDYRGEIKVFPMGRRCR